MEFLSVKQIAEMAQLNEATVRRMIHENKLVSEKKTSNKKGYLVSAEELLKKGVITDKDIEAYAQETKETDESELYAWRNVLSDFDMELIPETVKKLYGEFNALGKKRGEFLASLSKKRQECARLEELADCCEKEANEIIRYIERLNDIRKNGAAEEQ